MTPQPDAPACCGALLEPPPQPHPHPHPHPHHHPHPHPQVKWADMDDIGEDTSAYMQSLVAVAREMMPQLGEALHKVTMCICACMGEGLHKGTMYICACVHACFNPKPSQPYHPNPLNPDPTAHFLALALTLTLALILTLNPIPGFYPNPSPDTGP